jgi:translocator protein
MKKILRLALSVGLPLMVGAIAGIFTSSAVKGWYSGLIKPSFNPPNWVFAPVWTALYIMMGIAFYIVWQTKPNERLKKAIPFYTIQLALNFSWSLVFFYLHQPGWALVNIILLWIFIAVTIYHFSKISKAAAWLLVPYILWVSFASALNWAIWQLN